MKDVKPGDVVHVRATVKEVYSDEILLVGAGATSMWTANANIVHIEPAPLKVGDRVQQLGCSGVGEICFVDFARAAVRWSDGHYGWPRLSHLTRINGGDRE